MISVELEQRMAMFYAHTDTMEEWENVLGNALVDIIWKNDHKLTDDELFEYGTEVIVEYLGKWGLKFLVLEDDPSPGVLGPFI